MLCVKIIYTVAYVCEYVYITFYEEAVVYQTELICVGRTTVWAWVSVGGCNFNEEICIVASTVYCNI